MLSIASLDVSMGTTMPSRSFDQFRTGTVVPIITKPDTDDEPAAIHLPAWFWSARPELAHISQAARARMMGRDALLGVVLARVAALSSHLLRIPAIVGSDCGLTFYVGVIGPSGASKTSAAKAAQQLLPCDDPTVADMLPVGSGEGLVEVLFDRVDEDGTGKTKVKKQTRFGAVVYIDEGAVLGPLKDRRGSTLLSVLRSAFTHGPLGQANASADTTRILAGDRYVYGLTMGVQPEHAGPLLDDVAAGTPQRFVWLSASDPDMPDEAEDWPGALPWKRLELNYAGDGIHVAESIWHEVRADRLAVMRGQKEQDDLDSHRMLVRLKVATLLALLAGRAAVGGQDWELAGVVLDTSDAVRAGIQAALAAAAHGREQAQTDRLVRQERTVDDDRSARALLSAARSVARAVRSHDVQRQHETERGCTRRCLTQAMAGKHRDLVGPDVIITEAEQRDWIVRDAERWTPGREQPS